MGFRIPKHLRDSIYRRFNKTEFDESVFVQTPIPNTRPSYIEAAISAYGLSIKARQQPLIKGVTMFNTDSFSNTKPVFNMLDGVLEDNLIKVINVDERIFEMIITHGLRAVHIDANAEFELNNEQTIIIKCGDAALIVYAAGLCKSKLSTHLSLLEFKLADRPLP